MENKYCHVIRGFEYCIYNRLCGFNAGRNSTSSEGVILPDEKKTEKREDKKDEITWAPKKSVMIEIQETLREKPKENPKKTTNDS